MNKAELIDVMAAEAGLTKADAKKALEAFINTTSKSLQEGDKVTLVGFGTFSVLPIPFHMALAWLFGALIQTVAAGFILGAVMKEPRQSVPI